MKQSYYFLAELLAGPLASQAQQSSPPAYRYYGGLALYSSDYQYVAGDSPLDLTIPVQATLGYQLRPRLAVQTSLAYSQDVTNYNKFDFTDIVSPTYRTANNYYGRAMKRSYSLALTARYALTRKQLHRVQVEVLGGFTLEKGNYASAYQHTFTRMDSAGTTSTNSFYQAGYTYSQWLVTAGLGARYRCSRRLTAVLDVTLNSSLARLESPPTLAGALGLRYRFGGLR